MVTIEAMQTGFVVLTLVMAAVVVVGVRRAGTVREAWVTGAVLGGWLLLTAVLAQSGVLSRFDLKPPAILRLLLPTGITTVFLGLSGWGRRLIDGLPLWVIVGAQSFRIPVELLLFGLYKAGGIPAQMTFHGGNFDILTGLLALVVAWRLRSQPSTSLVLGWNVLGMALLTTIVIIANLSAPTSYRVFHDGPSSALIATAPLIWLPVFLVQLALLGHVLVFRAVLSRRASGAAVPARA